MRGAALSSRFSHIALWRSPGVGLHRRRGPLLWRSWGEGIVVWGSTEKDVRVPWIIFKVQKWRCWCMYMYVYMYIHGLVRVAGSWSMVGTWWGCCQRESVVSRVCTTSDYLHYRGKPIGTVVTLLPPSQGCRLLPQVPLQYLRSTRTKESKKQQSVRSSEPTLPCGISNPTSKSEVALGVF